MSDAENDDEPLLLNIRTAARRLSLSERKVYDLIYAGDLKSVTVGRARRIRASELKRYVRSLEH